jgi:hypothetical protein
MVNNMKDNTLMVVKMVEEFLLGLMEMCMKESFEIIKWKESAYLDGEINNMKENGMIVR